MVGAAVSVDFGVLAREAGRRQHAAVALFLLAVGVLFGALWSTEIARSLAAGTTPASALEVGLGVNPVHVLDLAFVCPGLLVTSALLWRRRALGLLFAVPLLVFSALMGMAIVSMMAVMASRGLPAPPGPTVMISGIAALSVWLAARFLATVRTEPDPS
jgi:hypothetical protein